MAPSLPESTWGEAACTTVVQAANWSLFGLLITLLCLAQLVWTEGTGRKGRFNSYTQILPILLTSGNGEFFVTQT